MSMKVYAFGLALSRFVALVVLALLPTIILVVAYRKCKGLPLYSLADIPAAAEVTVCIAWISLLTVAADMIAIHLGGLPLHMHFAATALAAALAAVPVGVSSAEIARLRERLGVDDMAAA